MDGEARDDGIEVAEARQRVVEVVLDDLDAVVAREPTAGRLQHRWRHVEADPAGRRPRSQYEAEQPAVSRSEVEETTDLLWQGFDKRRLALGAPRQLILD